MSQTTGSVQPLIEVDGERNHDSILEQCSAIIAEIRGDGNKAAKQKDAEKFFCRFEKKQFSQQATGVCIGCRASVTGTGSSRFIAHVLRCPVLPSRVSALFKDVHDAQEGKKRAKAETRVALREENERLEAEHACKKAKLRQEGIKASFKANESELARKAIAKFFYENGISFSAANTELTSSYQEMIRAIKQTPVSFVPPNRKAIAGPLLDECYDDMRRSIKERDPEGKMACKFGAAYVSDGWDSVTNRPLVNSAFISNNDGGVFWRSVDTSGKVKNADYLASLMIQDIYDYGCSNVTVVVTDTCATMRKCWEILEDEFPWLMILPCQTHVLSLLMKDLAKALPIKEVTKR